MTERISRLARMERAYALLKREYERKIFACGILRRALLHEEAAVMGSLELLPAVRDLLVPGVTARLSRVCENLASVERDSEQLKDVKISIHLRAKSACYLRKTLTDSEVRRREGMTLMESICQALPVSLPQDDQ